ncbi:MAG: hypothetical protein AVDCRST_MAG96-3359, partial [uncultured Segetibacter sp.]
MPLNIYTAILNAKSSTKRKHQEKDDGITL